MPTFERLAGPPPELSRPPRPAEIDPNWRRRKRFWTPDRLMRLADLIEQGRSLAQISRHFGVSPEAVNLARKKAGIPSQRQVISSARAVAAQLGFGDSKKVAWLCNRGWLKGRRGQWAGPGNKRWLITEEAVLAFLRDPVHWHRWEPGDITDADLREWATELRAGVRFLTATEVARRYHVEVPTVGQWLNRGELPGVDTGSHRLIREADLAGFVPPGERPRRATRQRWYTPEEDRRMVALRQSGWSWKRIGRDLHTDPCRVRQRFAELEARGAVRWEPVACSIAGVVLAEVSRLDQSSAREPAA